MFTSRTLTSCLLLMASIFAFSGCGKTDSATAENVVDHSDLMSELLGDIDLTEGGPAEPTITQVSDAKPAEEAMTANNLVASFSQPPSVSVTNGQQLELRLSQGDSFQLVKTVKQNLTQKSQQFPAQAETQLELHMQISVEQVQTDASLLAIQYSRIIFQQDINGQRMSFDSQTQGANVPAGLAPYAGMIGNGFRFWLGKDNVIQKTVGYEDFLQRCVRQVPTEQQSSVLTSIATKFGNDGVANFVDDSIGLLPYNHSASAPAMVSTGDVWTKKRRLMDSAPIEIQSTCRLQSMTDRAATIEITGTISAIANAGSQFGSSVRIQGGRSMGSCVVDRATGLPLEVNRSTFLSMEVATASGQTVQQDKTIETKIRTLPATRGLVVSHPRTNQQQHIGQQTQPLRQAATYPNTAQQQQIQQTSGIAGQRLSNQLQGSPSQPQPIDNSNLSSTATAVYPD